MPSASTIILMTNPFHLTSPAGWDTHVREVFVRYLAAAPRLERRWPGLFVWPGKGRYERALRRQQANAKQNAMQRIEYNEGT